MSSLAHQAVPGYQSEVALDLHNPATRKRLSPAAIAGFFFIVVDAWSISIEQAAELLGGVPRSTMYKLRDTSPTLRQDELTRISYLVGMYKALHNLLPEELADCWISRPNDNALFGGRSPLEYMMRSGIPGFGSVRRLLDAALEGV